MKHCRVSTNHGIIAFILYTNFNIHRLEFPIQENCIPFIYKTCIYLIKMKFQEFIALL